MKSELGLITVPLSAANEQTTSGAEGKTSNKMRYRKTSDTDLGTGTRINGRKCCLGLPCIIAFLLLLNLCWFIYQYQSPTCDSTVPSVVDSRANVPLVDQFGENNEYLYPEMREMVAENSDDEISMKAPGPLVHKVDFATHDRLLRAKDKNKMDELMHKLLTYGRVGLMDRNPLLLESMKDRLPDHLNLDSVYWRFSLQISNFGLYIPETSNNGKLVDELVHSMATSPVEYLESISDKGTELKLMARFKDGSVAVMKPERMERHLEVGENIWYNAESERHFAEIAAYHLDRLLGFARVPPCVGRLFNITSEIIPYVDDTLLKSLHTSPGGNLCYFGKCRYLCDLFHPVCGKPDVIEYSACVFVPRDYWETRNRYSPWRRSYNYHWLADWQDAANNETYCQKSVLTDELYSSGRTLLDLVDCLVFDFLTGNEDRHSYNKFADFLNISTLINYDNGRAFGRPYRDQMDSLAPLYQCCMLRKTTYEKLKMIKENEHGIALSDLMRYSLSKDPLTKYAPILTERQLQALDRRIKIIFDVINRDCLTKKSMTLEQLLIDDGY